MKAILSIVLLAVAIVSIVYFIINSYRHPWFSWIAFIIFVPSLTIGLGLFQQANPTKQDVIDGRAYYQETQVITCNDTIKTYNIVWK